MSDPRPLACVERGTGAPAWLFLHSLGGHGGFWLKTVAHIGQRHRAVAVDLRGHGDSVLAPDQPGANVREHLHDVLATADMLGLQRFVLVGHSFGALVALSLAAVAPARVLGLVLVDAAGSMSALPPEVIADFVASIENDADGSFVRDNYASNLTRSTPGSRAEVLERLAHTPRVVIARGYRDLLEAEPAPLLTRYPGPTLLVADAANDSPFSLHAQMPDLPVRLIAGTSHWIPLDQPDGLNAILDDFDRSLSSASS